MWLRLGCLIFLICVAVPGYAETDPVVEWKKEISNRLTAGRRFPPEARGQTGSAAVGFVIDRSGKLISSWLKESTGSPVLDAEALAMIERAQPFPTPPPEADGDHVSLAVPINFARRGTMPLAPMTEAEIRKQDGAIREENSAINARLRGLCRGC